MTSSHAPYAGFFFSCMKPSSETVCYAQLVSARADTDQWKRRAGVLFLKMSSVQEDVDMYAMRCRLLEAEASRESARTQAYKVCRSNSHIASCMEILHVRVTQTLGKYAPCGALVALDTDVRTP